MSFRKFAKRIRVYMNYTGNQNIIVYIADEHNYPPHRFNILDEAVRQYGDREIDDEIACMIYPDEVTFWLQ